MEQSPSWEGNWLSDSQEIPLTLCNPKVHYRIHKFPATVPILNQIDQVHLPTSHFLKIHLNIILPPMPGSNKFTLKNTTLQLNQNLLTEFEVQFYSNFRVDESLFIPFVISLSVIDTYRKFPTYLQ
jgi:hypothetical protein